ncbi:hypothetical protein DAEQUDRAFT_96850 [Daedalea quercina L-15889]|uniref:Uncharacterized protein n=1 Tax=Daedalea quercina L-15889 TaxID=1314783 RepID=A0A165SBY0_9APHY|nr:hypothetical protein DAEQUDRAFT_96850 [Daedalea quercina L-15889]
MTPKDFMQGRKRDLGTGRDAAGNRTYLRLEMGLRARDLLDESMGARARGPRRVAIGKARLARENAERRWRREARAVDRLPPGPCVGLNCEAGGVPVCSEEAWTRPSWRTARSPRKRPRAVCSL